MPTESVLLMGFGVPATNRQCEENASEECSLRAGSKNIEHGGGGANPSKKKSAPEKEKAPSHKGKAKLKNPPLTGGIGGKLDLMLIADPFWRPGKGKTERGRRNCTEGARGVKNHRDECCGERRNPT